MVSFLFWNLNRKDVGKRVAKIALRNEVDIIMLVENIINAANLLEELNRDGDTIYSYAPGWVENKVSIFTRFPEKFLIPIFDTKRLAIRNLKLPLMIDILLAVTHFPSKNHEDAERRLSATIMILSSRSNTSRIISSSTLGNPVCLRSLLMPVLPLLDPNVHRIFL